MIIDYDEINNILHNVNLISTVLRIFFTMLMRGILGFEIEIKNRPAEF